MSARARAKKPVSKKVAALLEELQRRRGVKDLAKRFLIVCEDQESSRAYFEALKDHFKLSAASIEVAGSEGHTQPIQVVERAIALKERAADTDDNSTVRFDHVWCVIDGDYGHKIANARSKAQANEIELAISTMCFEYWILLHFEETDKSTLNCDALVRSLKKRHLPGYTKGNCDYGPIVTHVRGACARAKKLRKPGIQRRALPENQNPCSEVYKLVEAILGAMP